MHQADARDFELDRLQAEIEWLMAALENARRDFGAICPKYGSKRFVIQAAIKRIEDALEEPTRPHVRQP